jgi:hypothetical protein
MLLAYLPRPAPLTLENAELRVSLDRDTGRFEVLDKGTQYTWRQTEGPALRVEEVQQKSDRFRLQTSIGGVSGWIELRLMPRSRNLTISMEAAPDAKIQTFDFLPPFQPASGSYLAVADYTDGHMYPCDLESWPLYNLDRVNVNALDMPWIGIFDLRSGSGYSVMVDTPFDAAFRCVKTAGQRAPWVCWQPEKGRFGYKRALTYHFSARNGYVDQAKAFRARTQLGKLEAKARRNPNIRKLYGAPELWDFPHLVSDTELKVLGVDKCVHHVQDWGAHGEAIKTANALGYLTQDYDYYLSSHPISPEHPYLSGTSGRGYYGDWNHVVVGANGKYRGEGDWLERCPVHYRTVAEKIIPPRLAKFPTGAIYLDQLTADYLGVTDGYLGGGSLEECYAPEHPLGRKEWSGAVCDLLKYIVSLGQIPAAEHGKWWEVPYTSIFYGIPSVQWPWPDVTFPTAEGNDEKWQYYRKWGTAGHTYRIPLWQLVFHDSAISMWYPWDVNDVTVNIPGDWIQEMKDASSVLYGVPAGFMVTEAGTGSWFKDRHKFMTSYRNTAKLHEVLADQEMVSHRFVTENRDVQETRWSDGTVVVVNFGTDEYSSAGLRLRRFGWSAAGPWGKASKAFDSELNRAVTTISKPGYHFDDRASSNGHPVAMAMTTVDRNHLRVNVDALPKPISLNLTLPWSPAGTRIYQRDLRTGARLGQVDWKSDGGKSVTLPPLPGWLALDVERNVR